jgi:hypothetical protein
MIPPDRAAPRDRDAGCDRATPQQSQRTQAYYIGGIFGLIERYPYVRLRRQVVHLVGSHLLDDAPDAGPIAEVSIMKLQPTSRRIETSSQVVDTPGGKAGAAPDDAMDFVALLEQKLREIRSVLSGHSGYERYFSQIDPGFAARLVAFGQAM